MSSVKTPQDIEAMREGGRMLATVLEAAKAITVAGVSTLEISEFAEHELKKIGGQPAFLGYHGFPAAMCTSVNEEVVHGIPSAKRKLKEGDIVSLDFGVRYKGLITDGAISVYIGDLNAADADTRKLMTITEQALYAGIDAVKADVHVGTIGNTIQKVLDKHKLGIVRDLVGHGVGYEIHEDPNIPNYGAKGAGARLRAGMTVAIEPMATLGGWQVDILSDDWTVITRDRSKAAHFEHTIVVTESGADILTRL